MGLIRAVMLIDTEGEGINVWRNGKGLEVFCSGCRTGKKILLDRLSLEVGHCSENGTHHGDL
jgi:hypothetical protein